MSAPVLLGLGILGGLGAIARFLLDGSVSNRTGREFPYGTLAVNLLGALLLGILAGADIGRDEYAVAGTGLIGGFTTFSTWMLETQRLSEDGRPGGGLLNLIISLALGIAAAWAGGHLGSRL